LLYLGNLPTVLPKDASNINEFNEEHKPNCYFEHSLTLKLVEFFLLAEKFLLPDAAKTAALDKLVSMQKSKYIPDSEPLPFKLLNRTLDRTSLHLPLRKLILSYISSDSLDKNSFMARISSDRSSRGRVGFWSRPGPPRWPVRP